MGDSVRSLAIIPDGNRREATRHGFPPITGHVWGLRKIREITEAAFERGVRQVTVWGASSLNLERRDKERDTLALAPPQRRTSVSAG